LLLTGTIGAMMFVNNLFTLNDFGLEDMVSIFYSAVTLDSWHKGVECGSKETL
jgi:hypothetical protein